MQQGADYLIWLNDDCRVTPETIADLVQNCQEHPQTIVGAQGFELENPETALLWWQAQNLERLSILNRRTWSSRPLRHAQRQPGLHPPCRGRNHRLSQPCRNPSLRRRFPLFTKSPKSRLPTLCRYSPSVFNHSGEPRLNPTDWVMTPGSPWHVLQLATNPYSGLSWRLWWQFNWEAYGLWGIVMFLKKYLSLVPITLLRCLPITWRQRLFPHRAQPVPDHAVSSS
jgi:hypothetical protein